MKRMILPALVATMISVATSGPAVAQSAPDAGVRMNELGPENGRLAARVGTWTVTETVWDAPGSAPKISTGLIAERRMVGGFLQEALRDPKDPKGTILRLDYLSFNRVEGRWEYVSMETRAAVGMMTAQSVGRGDAGRIGVVFQPFALPGGGQAVSGQMLRMRQDVVLTTADRDTKDQFFTLADGAGTEWLAHRYDYVRR